jgi:hypothetical protein
MGHRAAHCWQKERNKTKRPQGYQGNQGNRNNPNELVAFEQPDSEVLL